jgi:hypothetical protein
VITALEIITDLYEFNQLSSCTTAIHGYVLCIMDKICVPAIHSWLYVVLYVVDKTCVSVVYIKDENCVFVMFSLLFFLFKFDIGDGSCENKSLMSVISVKCFAISCHC